MNLKLNEITFTDLIVEPQIKPMGFLYQINKGGGFPQELWSCHPLGRQLEIKELLDFFHSI